MNRSFRYQLRPTGRQTESLVALLDVQRELYNAALEERIGAWKWERRSVPYFDQCRTLTGLREVRPDVLAWGVIVCRGTLKRLDRAFAAFYRRCRTGETPGFPRFKGKHRWDSVQWEDTAGWKISDAGRLYLQGVGHVKVNLHRPLRGVPKAITVKREGRRWYVSIRCVDVPAQPLPTTGRAVGVDRGITALVATSDGELIANERFGQRAAKRLAKAQQDLARKKRGGGRRRRAVERVARCHRQAQRQRADFAHKLSRLLVNDHDVIVLEDLKVANMIRRPKPRPNNEGGFDPNGAAAKAGLNRSIQDAGWASLAQMILYKAEDAGRDVILVPAAYTSQTCHQCGHVAAGNRHEQQFRCTSCGHADHADVNAARNILRAGLALRDASAEREAQG